MSNRATSIALGLLVAACASAGEGDGQGNSGPDAGGFDPFDARPQPRSDASFPPADAAPRPDAPCTPSTAQILLNPDFDMGPGGGWIEDAQSQYPIITTPGGSPSFPQTPHSGSYAAWLGGVNGSIDALFQDVALPADAADLAVEGFYWISSSEQPTQPYDTVRIQLRTPENVLIAALGELSNLDENGGWQPFALTPGDQYAGQTVRLHVESDTDGSVITNFYLDSLALTVTTCQ